MFLKNGEAIGVVSEKDDEQPDKSTRLRIENTNGTLYIKPEGYGDSCSMDENGCPILIERWNGELRVVVWADVNQEDPTHIISLEPAHIERRVEG
jgi:hypothetical protein